MKALILLLLVAVPWSVGAQFTFSTNSGSLFIQQSTGTGGVVIPATTNGLPIFGIGGFAFLNNAGITSLEIPNTVTNIGSGAFLSCSSLTAITVDASNQFYSSVNGVLFNKDQTTLVQYPPGLDGNYTIPPGVTIIGHSAFETCMNMTHFTIPDTVTVISDAAFYHCANLTNIKVGSGVTNVWFGAFISCDKLKGIYFRGNAPYGHPGEPLGAQPIIYYLPGTSGWYSPFFGYLAALWLPQVQTGDASFGVQANQFGFNIQWAGDMAVVVEACTDLAHPVWLPVSTNMLSSSGASLFNDPQSMNYPARYYRLRSP
jgi:hypothetical protein